MTVQEGVTRFRIDHDDRAHDVDLALCASLDAWRGVLMRLGLIGAAPARYEGIGFGNLSARTPSGFVITGTQTGHLATLAPSDFAHIDAAWPAENRVQSHGTTRPSSESMTHAAVYSARSDVQAVFHTHAPAIWRVAERLGMATSPTDVDYGTPEMAALVSAEVVASTGAMAMLGHEDGVIVWAPTIEIAGAQTVALLARAFALSRA